MGFNFRDQNIRLEICGEFYNIPVTSDLMNSVKEVGQELAESGKAVTDEKDVEALCEKCAGFVDRLLGTGADERIFRGRVKNIYDYIDLLTYISNGITAFTRQRTPKNNPYYNKKRKRK